MIIFCRLLLIPWHDNPNREIGEMKKLFQNVMYLVGFNLGSPGWEPSTLTTTLSENCWFQLPKIDLNFLGSPNELGLLHQGINNNLRWKMIFLGDYNSRYVTNMHENHQIGNNFKCTSILNEWTNLFINCLIAA